MMIAMQEHPSEDAQFPILCGNDCARRDPLDFVLPAELQASEPPEARGLSRDEVRLMVSYRSNDHVLHSRFRALGDFLSAGDVLVINTSGTMKAALHAWRTDGTPLELHLSTHLPADIWIVEVRTHDGKVLAPSFLKADGETLRLEGGGQVRLHTPYRVSDDTRMVRRDEVGRAGQVERDGQVGRDKSRPYGVSRQRLWLATLDLPTPLYAYLDCYGFPIRYSYVKDQWPIAYYQSVYVTEVGSAEMPSAGRAFTPELITQLVARGVQFAPLLLHTGVASPEEHEPPYEEYYRVPRESANIINAARASGKRVIAVGTTVIRTLETVTDEAAVTHPGEGWTRMIVTPQRGIHAVNALLTGLHEPRATHLLMLEALAGRPHLAVAYREALQSSYLWHEFGDLHLLLP